MMFTKEDNDLIYKEFESLRLASLKRCANKEEYEGVVRAFEFANEAHKGVRRRSGEPYILHPIAVAKIVVQEIGLGYKSIVTALLHDIVEDTEYTVEDISRLFGEKVASLVDGLTKIKSAMDTNHNKAQGGDKNAKLSENQEKSLQAENFKRILLTLNDDVRVILIKLADRLHNLRTIDSMPERKKDKILSETMYIFIPLAHRLGLYSIKSEMENIWLRFRQPDDYAYIQKKLAIYTQEKSCDIDRFIEPIEKILKKEGYKFTISKRTKTPYSIWRKMQNKGIQFDQIYDLFAIRIIFEPKEGITERQQCYDIFSLISADYISKPDRLRDWVGRPKSNGYEALHCTLMSTLGNWMEVQIRSRRMDEIAERGLAAHWSYKGVQKNESELDNWLNMVREVLENPDVSALEFLDKFHASLLSSEIYVFTPTGESKKLQKGATALDFAYYIHSKIGERAIAAKVNLKLVPLSHVLQNGDQVEIITAETQKPKREWLDFVTTTKAKRLIYDSLKADIKNAIKEGQNALDQALAKLGVTPQNRVFKKLLLEYNLNNKDELYNKIGTGLIDLSELEKVLKKNNENKFVKFWNLQFFFGNSDKEKDDQEGDDTQNEAKRPKVDKKKDYLLEENPLDKTLSYKAAECCNPIPGDPIIGFLDDNNEVVIHKKVCPHAISLASRQGGKIVNAKWTKHTILSFLARIGLKGIDRIGIVNEITKYITLVLSVNIRKIHFETHDGIFEGYIDLYVHNTEDLEMIMKRMLKIKGVESATRTDIKE
ncbi:MAG: bifunctional (p)ppGpp synthetase/guanosine-3',5'-bis(diphosphate) 3'-pyrophosphohydrolase [Bacteroidales bacterium]|nr:bifunctional (p)ppGpp synthetase/guanosine-3',5'-bis(diphosphate) 3'-pyrophosphohydrolase [Bacteroidales bacterium]MBQ7998985.1 bifunctional (p)ppGpp synthetase/guanosine-3',5'-bis(diphosphate) 3'-pyrophosphohydrolase [Bacteroidales bacterium]MBR4095040.1 bifunctional (p)ppGpp synthetase/guanosine-3',5'-bis(diphosphate) 3'-pyrophosphohydrolase [Bacteroidales bacterium]